MEIHFGTAGATLLAAIMMAAIGIAVDLPSVDPASFTGESREQAEEFLRELWKEPRVGLLAMVLAGVTIFILAALCWLLLVLPVGVILLLMLLFRIVEFVVARIAENPKGPIFALSAVFTAIGGLVKVFD